MESGDALQKQVYDALKERLAQLNHTRQQLHSQFAGVCACVCVCVRL
jgi:hypothetical protein